MIRSHRSLALLLAFTAIVSALPTSAQAQEARRRWERMCQIRAEKFDLVLPTVLQDNDIDMWIVVMREGKLDPLWEALGRGYVGDWAYYVFTDQGDRAHRAAFAEAGEMSREIAERAFSNEVITPGVTTLEDVAWWMWDQLLARGLDSSFDMPSVYVTGPEGIVATSTDRIIQRGDLLMIDWGVGFLDFYTDMKRIAYVLKEGETEAPAGLRHAFDQAVKVRDVMKATIAPAPTAKIALERTEAALREAGFNLVPFNQPSADPALTDVVLGPHSVGNWGHGIGPSLAFFNPTRQTYELRPGTLISVELFAYTANPDWGGRKVRIPLEDDAVVTQRGVEWLYPVNRRILLIK